MPHEVIMPTLGLTMEEGTITEWLKREGDSVEKDEPLFVVETDKAAMEVPSPASGVVSKIIAQVGVPIPVRQAIAVIAEPGEAAAAPPTASDAPPSGAAPPAPPVAPSTPAPASTAQVAPPPTPATTGPSAVARARVSPRARLVARQLGVDLSSLVGSGPEGRVVERDVRAVTTGMPAAAAPATSPGAPAAPTAPERIFASPLARKLAAEHGLDLAGLVGSGPNGRIVERDIQAAIAARPVVVPAAQPTATPMTGAPTLGAPTLGAPTTAAPTPVVMPTGAPGEPVPLSRLRRVTAERMAASARSVARVTLFMTVDMAEAVRFRTQVAPEFERRFGNRLGYDAMLAKAAAQALRDHPELNAQWAEGAVRPLQQVNIGTAVALDEGLLVVVVRDVDAKPLHQIQAELNELVEKARAGRFGPDDVTGASFTITNLGAYGVEAFTPIVNLPEAGILGVGQIARQPAVVENQVVPREQMTLSLAFDHRVTDGAPAARFLRRLKEILEAPYILLT